MSIPPRMEFGSLKSVPRFHQNTKLPASQLFKQVRKKLLASIKDYTHRAEACRRAGRRRSEANSFYCMGVLYDNMKEYLKAIGCYQKFRRVLRSSEDKFAEALAHNSIGVSYHNLGPEYAQHAIYHYSKHRDIADVPGKFIAYTNLGLIYEQLGYSDLATANFQMALRSAIRMSSVAGQSIAIGNLGLAGLKNDDLDTAKACMERHLELSHSLQDVRGKNTALYKLGQIASQEGNFHEASRFFRRALSQAERMGDNNARDTAKVNLGISLGNASLDDHMKKIAADMMEARARMADSK